MLQRLDGSAIFARKLIPCVKQWDGTSLLWTMHQGSKKEKLKDMKDMKGGNCCTICIDDLLRVKSRNDLEQVMQETILILWICMLSSHFFVRFVWGSRSVLTLEAFVSGFMPFALGLGRLGHGGHVHLTSSCSILHHLAIYCHGPHRLTLLLCLGVV